LAWVISSSFDTGEGERERCLKDDFDIDKVVRKLSRQTVFIIFSLLLWQGELAALVSNRDFGEILSPLYARSEQTEYHHK
jgi:hypothetical protein